MSGLEYTFTITEPVTKLSVSHTTSIEAVNAQSVVALLSQLRAELTQKAWRWAEAMKNAPGKRTYVVLVSIVRNGRNMEVGDEFEASPVGVHVLRWLKEGRIEAR